MAQIVAMPFRHQKSLICDEARKMLTDAGFTLVCNESGAKLSEAELLDMIKDAFAVIAGTERYEAPLLSKCGELRALMRFGVGTDNLDLKKLRSMGVQVGLIANHNAVAEFALGQLLALLKNGPRFDAAARKGLWSRYPMFELSGRTVAIIGFGRIGRRLAELLQGFGVTLLAYDPYMDEEAAKERGVAPCGFEEALSRADVVSLHLPSTPETFHLMNSDTIALMKDGAYLVNTARGSLVDEKALYAALKSGKLAGAAIDVFETEPLTADNILLSLENTVLSPHAAALSYETNYNGGLICAESIIRVRDGGRPLYPLW